MKRIYIVLDGCFTGTGVRNINSHEWMEISELAISSSLKTSIERWANEYQKYIPSGMVKIEDKIFKTLDEEGVKLSKAIMQENNEYKIDYYYSDFGGRIYLNP